MVRGGKILHFLVVKKSREDTSQRKQFITDNIVFWRGGMEQCGLKQILLGYDGGEVHEAIAVHMFDSFPLKLTINWEG